MNRTAPLRRMSAKKAKEYRESRPIVAAVLERDGGCVLAGLDWGPCFGDHSGHHIKKQSAGGEWTPWNLVRLCCAHQAAVEDFPDAAEAQGLVLRRGLTEGDVWRRMYAAGLRVGWQSCRAAVENWSITGSPDIEGRVTCPACGGLAPTTTDPVRSDLRVIGLHRIGGES